MRYLSQASYALATVLVLILKKAPLLAISVFQHQPQEEAKGETVQPWFTGPLLAPSGTVIPTGHVNIQPYLFSQVITGYYNHHWQVDTIDNFYNNWFQLYTGIGLPNSLNITFAPQMIWNRTQGQNYAGFGDMPVALAYQLYFSQINSWVPSLKTAFEFNVPIGKYNKLNPRKKFTDALGAGSWLPTFKLVASGSKQFGNSIYFLNTRLAFAYIIGTKTFVKGLNSYGGGEKTKGWVYPGNTFQTDLSFEASLSRNWGAAIDVVYIHFNKTRFSGTKENATKLPSGEQFSISPAIEYNWNSSIGAIAGVWLTLAGRNSLQFTTGILSVNLYF